MSCEGMNGGIVLAIARGRFRRSVGGGTGTSVTASWESSSFSPSTEGPVDEAVGDDDADRCLCSKARALHSPLYVSQGALYVHAYLVFQRCSWRRRQ